jgi:hypothetical protein
MNGIALAPDLSRFSEVKRKLLARYLLGDLAPAERQAHEITRRPLNEPAPLSLAQQQLWYREQIEGITPLYNESITIRRRGALDIAALERSLAEIVRRHEIWRTVYDSSNGMPVQVVKPAPSCFPLQMVNLRGYDEAEIEAEVLRVTTNETQQRFDLRHGPLLRAMLLRTDDEEYRLFITAHLSIIDGISVYQILPTELAALYAANCVGNPAPLPELCIQYADYAHWQRRNVSGRHRAEQLAYWRTQFASEPPSLRWPTGRQQPVFQTYRGQIRRFALSNELTCALKDFSRNEHVTLFTILAASFCCLLYSYTRQVDLVIGTPSPAGRKLPETQPLLGYFLNPVALRIDLQGDPTFRELRLRVQKALATAMCYDDVPLEVIAKELQLKGTTARNPFFTTAISLQPKTPKAAEEWRVTSMDADSGGAPWDLYVAFIDRAEEILGRVQYNPDLFESAAISGMLNDLQSLMKVITEDPGQRLSEISDSF